MTFLNAHWNWGWSFGDCFTNDMQALNKCCYSDFFNSLTEHSIRNVSIRTSLLIAAELTPRSHDTETTDWQTHPKVEEDAEEGERAEKASGQCFHKFGLVLGWDNLSVPFSAGRTVTAKLQWQCKQRWENNKMPTEFVFSIYLLLLWQQSNRAAIWNL